MAEPRIRVVVTTKQASARIMVWVGAKLVLNEQHFDGSSYGAALVVLGEAMAAVLRHQVTAEVRRGA